jgi:hypothetical protein
MATSYILLAALLALVSWQAVASDPSPLQDFCVADKYSPGKYILTHALLKLDHCAALYRHSSRYINRTWSFSCMCFAS